MFSNVSNTYQVYFLEKKGVFFSPNKKQISKKKNLIKQLTFTSIFKTMKAHLTNFFRKCIHGIKTKPLLRGMAIYSITYPTGSFIQQSLNKEQEKIDYRRILKFTLFGSLIIAPGANLWIHFVNRVFTGNSILSSYGKVGLEQIIWSPLFYTVFYFGLTIMEGKSIEAALFEVKTKAFHTYTVGLAVWPFLQLYNYSYVSDKNRLVFMATFGLLWTIYLSYTKYVLQTHNHESVSDQKNSSTDNR